MSKGASGNFFEDFRLSQTFHHATPRTARQSEPFACAIGYTAPTIDRGRRDYGLAGKARPEGLEDVGALRLITRATRNLTAAALPTAPADKDEPGVALDLDYWVLMPR